MNSHLPAQLSERLRRPLPGWRVQAAWQPELSFGRYFGPVPGYARPAAVLILLYPRGDQWYLPLTLRPTHLEAHAGQISLPGGLVEANERSPDAALRELHEELGIAPANVTLLGELSSIYLFRSNFQIAPWVATLDHYPTWIPSPAEVAELIEVPLDHLLDPLCRHNVTQMSRGVSLRAPSFRWQSHEIWGATSIILAELVALVSELAI